MARREHLRGGVGRGAIAIACVVVAACGGGGGGTSGGSEGGEETSGSVGGEGTTSGATDGESTGGDDASETTAGIDDGGDEWQPPIGIPEPPFGVREETPAMPEPWDAAMAGFYYVDNTHPKAVTDETYEGTPAMPRATIPTLLPAGATVWIAGGPYVGSIGVGALGTEDAPVFVSAADPEQPPELQGAVGLGGSWLVVEHLDVAGQQSVIAIGTPSDHVAVRHCEVRDGEGGGAGLYTGRWNPEDDPATASNIVFWDNFIHDNGDVSADFDEDHHGIALGHHAEHVWILDNEMARNSGDGLQVNAKKAYLMPTLHHVYAGRNVAYANKQTGLWTKQATDVVFSQNVTYGHRPSNSSGGAGIGFQYGPERVWIIFNEIYDCELGITSSTNVGDEDGVAGQGQDVWIVGNVIHDIHKQDGSGASTDPWQAGAGIHFTDQSATKHVAFNTVHDTDVAFTYARGTGPVHLVNNVFTASLGAAVRIETAEAAAGSTIDFSLFDPGATIEWGTAGETEFAALLGQCEACVGGDPLFVDAGSGDFHLQAGSPAVDAAGPGDAAAVFDAAYGLPIGVDFDRVTRPVGTAEDMGAFER